MTEQAKVMKKKTYYAGEVTSRPDKDAELIFPPCSDNNNADACNDYGCWWEPSTDECIDFDNDD